MGHGRYAASQTVWACRVSGPAFVDQHGWRSLEIFGIDGVLFLSLLKCLGIVLALEAEIPQQDVEYF